MKKQLVSIMVLLCAVMFGQEVPQLSPPTPEVAALGKYTDIPVGLHTGTANVSIPLVSLSESGIDIPVSINYHASGIKVNEIASRVGLGWALQAGGMISRQVRGIGDDSAEGFLNTTNTVANYFDSSTDGNERTRLFELAQQGHQDYESDIYYFNFPGGSGKFFFDQNGSIYSHPKNDYDIKVISGFEGTSTKILGWEITTPSGMQYTFGIIPGSTNRVEEYKEHLPYTQNQQLPSSFGYNYVSGWYLTQIKDYKGNVVRFTYSKGSEKIAYYNLLGQSKYIQSVIPGANGNCSPPGDAASLSEEKYIPTFLTAIQGATSSIHFEYGTNRLDLKNDKALTSVTLKDANNTVIDRYELEHDYFATAPWKRLGTYGDLDQRTKKLYLKKIRQQKGSTVNKEHRFSYYQDHAFPERLSFDKDFWGYANGADNDKLYPGISYTNGIGGIFDIEGGDRSVNEAFAQTLLLKEITYPTGGSTHFTYESNTVSGNKSFFALNKFVRESIHGSWVGTPPDSGEVIRSTFTLDESAIVYYKSEVVEACQNNPTGEECPDLWLTDSNGNIILTFLGNSNNFAHPFTLEAGTYIMHAQNGLIPTSVDPDGTIRYDNHGNAQLYKRVLLEGVASETATAKTGGLRIKEMKFKDADGTVVNTKKYKYNYFSDTDRTSGRASNPPVFFQKNAPYLQGIMNCTYDVIQSNALFPQNGLSSYHVGYTNVTEINTDSTQGKIEYTYSFVADQHYYSENNQFTPGEGYPFAPAQDYSHQRGVLLGTKTHKYNQATQGFSVVEELKNTYSRKGEFLAPNIAMGYIGTASPEYTRYNNFSERYLMTGSTKTNYYPSGNVKTITAYTFDQGYQGRTFPVITTTTNSNGETIATKTYYPDDVTTTTALGESLSTAEYAAISALKSNGSQPRMGTAIQQETRINGTLMSTQRTNYKNWNGVVLPEIIQAAKGSDNLENRIEYLNYDTKGNPLEVQQTDGSHSIYIWGYNELYPIAKIDHATYIEMPTALTALIDQVKTTSNTDITPANEVTLRDLMNQLRDHTYFKESQLTSFTYDPLVGVTSVTDPRGYTMYYAYDTFNRLEYVKDDEGKLISENKYGYKN